MSILKEKLHYYQNSNLLVKVLDQNTRRINNLLSNLEIEQIKLPPKIGRLNGVRKDGCILVDYNLFEISKSQPIFYHLSDIIKEITVLGYNKDKPFIPIEHLAQLKHSDLSNYDKWNVYETRDDYCIEFIKTGNDDPIALKYYYITKETKDLPFYVVEKLIKWGFWLWDNKYFEDGTILRREII